MKLTERRLAVLRFIATRIERDGWAPSIRQIAAHFGKHYTTITSAMRWLEGAGCLRIGRGARAIAITPKGAQACGRSTSPAAL